MCYHCTGFFQFTILRVDAHEFEPNLHFELLIGNQGKRDFQILLRLRNVSIPQLGQSQQSLNLRHARLALDDRTKMRNRIGSLALKKQKDTQVALCLDVVGIDRRRRLKFWNRQIGALLIEKFLRLLDVRGQAGLLVVWGLSKAHGSGQQ